MLCPRMVLGNEGGRQEIFLFQIIKEYIYKYLPCTCNVLLTVWYKYYTIHIQTIKESNQLLKRPVFYAKKEQGKFRGGHRSSQKKEIHTQIAKRVYIR